MRFSEHWLRSFCNPPLSTQELAQALTMAGLEVEEVVPAAPPCDGVVVGEVMAVEPHPNAEKLTVCTVDVGGADKLNIVCGAPNAQSGIKVPCATIGAQLPGLKIKQAKLRGVSSEGMLCSAAELGTSDDHSGLMILDPASTVGEDIRQALDLDDKVFALTLTANRGDCLSLLGIAREVAAITGSELCFSPVAAVDSGLPDTMDITLSAQEACPRYTGLIIRGVDPSARTPDYIVRRLERSGVRSISAIVDLTNYVMLELGQPMHAFDHAKLSGAIDVRFARKGEKLELLNGQMLEPDPDMLMICDASGPVALAGIMGGASTAVSAETTDLFLESAFFSPKAVAGKWRRLGFTTDASHRYERGVDYEGSRRGIERLAGLILEVCGGKPGAINDVVATLPKRPEVQLRLPRVQRVLGMEIDEQRSREILARLNMSPRQSGDILSVTPPSYRFDIAIEEDLIEEIVRIEGYDKLPATLPAATAGMLSIPEERLDLARLRQIMVTRDYQEVVTYSFVDESWEKDFAGNDSPVRLANPIAEQLSVMRSSLLGSLVDCMRFNANRKQSRIRLFEISRVFVSQDDGFDQRMQLAALASGYAQPEQWASEKRPVDFFDLRGDLESLFAPRTVDFQPVPHLALHPGKSASVIVDGRRVGWIGELHPGLLQRYDIQEAVVAFEVDVEAVATRTLPSYQEYPKYPLVRRDIAIEIAEEVPAQTLLEAMKKGASAIVGDIEVFDLYRGKGIEKGKKGLAFRVLLQDTQKTLTEAEVDKAVEGLREILEREHGAKLR
ncbi:MAG: phenylalanine--tRNA ligase subunit beta [Betaproteobacteria bacterium]|nr:MAG: phenylalanine--tRNA ligase subunit beta [Betaproteobacteria bacterium]